MKKVFIFVNGIMTWPGDAKNWNGKAVTWTHTRTGHFAEKVEYWCGPIDRVFGQTGRALKLARTALRYGQDWEVTMVGHSNGADVIVDCLKCFAWAGNPLRLKLVCGATEADFHKNGLNRLLTLGRVSDVEVFVAEQDAALRLAHTWAARCLGYGVLGLHGPVNVLPSVAGRVRTVRWRGYGHSDCWTAGKLDGTMEELTHG